ncbi:hypothetical protein [Streptomyces candidus]|uniref:Lipoprotein n=1 Tax=Streptomyces candidus TaxID=67283 RepID=A0A7X0HKB0_9ACTN|nr:hypothetical protein [Streptomyces candidus]MBB6437723.1 hypothetical protein [Streptomyces candidus]GHH50442.1 lipoprotein [Streptomyces candidus]
MTRTAATFLVGVAVTAASGCMAAGTGPNGSPAAPQQPPASQPSAPRPQQPAGQGGQPERLVEAPVREVLEAALLPTEQLPEPRRPTARRADQGAVPGAVGRSEPKRAEPPARGATADRPDPGHPSARKSGKETGHKSRDDPGRGSAKRKRKANPAPELPKVPVTGAGVCALGTGYGGWKANSPEARICRETYGG